MWKIIRDTIDGMSNMWKIIRDTIDGMFKYVEDYKRYY